MIRRGCVALALLSTVLSGVTALAGPMTIELQEVPAVLKLPAPENENRIVTIIVRGDSPSEVWVARTAMFVIPKLFRWREIGEFQKHGAFCRGNRNSQSTWARL